MYGDKKSKMSFFFKYMNNWNMKPLGFKLRTKIWRICGVEWVSQD